MAREKFAGRDLMHKGQCMMTRGWLLEVRTDAPPQLRRRKVLGVQLVIQVWFAQAAPSLIPTRPVSSRENLSPDSSQMAGT